MIDLREYMKRLEDELRATRAVSEGAFWDFADLPAEHQAALSGVMAILRGADSTIRPDSAPVPEEIRVAGARLMLLKLRVDTRDPRWSSWALDRMLDMVMTTPGGSVSDLLRALFDLLGEEREPPSRETANLVIDITRACFVKYRNSFEANDFSWMTRTPGGRITAAQGYLAVYALPAAAVRAMEPQIRQVLAGTTFEREVERLLQLDAP